MFINDISSHVFLHRKIIECAITRVLDRSNFILGIEVDSFEKLLASYIGVPHCVAVASGTDAIELALRVSSVGPGDLVMTAANTGMYTSSAINLVGATPFFVDVNLETQLVEFDAIKSAVNKGVKAIVVTHLYGRLVPDIVQISKFCKERNVLLIEDCAQAIGAAKDGFFAGSFGDLSCFSFYPTKNLGALGDGGAIICKDDLVASTLRKLRQYGWGDCKYRVEISGGKNSRLDELQAAVLNEFIKLLPQWNSMRQEISRRYSAEIFNPRVILPPPPDESNVSHLYVLRCHNRDQLRKHLSSHNISSEVHYPIPDHMQPIFNGRHECILNAEALANEILTIPCYPEMTNDEVSMVIDVINSFNN